MRENIVATELERALQPLVGFDRVHAVRVNGAQAAIELLDGNGEPDADAVMRLQRRGLEHHIMIYAGGRHGNGVMLVPPINIDRSVLADGLTIIRDLIEQEASS